MLGCFSLLLLSAIPSLPQEVRVTTGQGPTHAVPQDSTQVTYDVHDLIDRTSPLWDSPADLASAANASTDDRGIQPALELGHSPDLEQRKQRMANLASRAF